MTAMRRWWRWWLECRQRRTPLARRQKINAEWTSEEFLRVSCSPSCVMLIFPMHIFFSIWANLLAGALTSGEQRTHSVAAEIDWKNGASNFKFPTDALLGGWTRLDVGTCTTCPMVGYPQSTQRRRSACLLVAAMEWSTYLLAYHLCTVDVEDDVVAATAVSLQFHRWIKKWSESINYHLTVINFIILLLFHRMVNARSHVSGDCSVACIFVSLILMEKGMKTAKTN